MDRRKVYKVPRVVENKVKEINDLIRWAKDKDGIVGGYFGSTYYSYLNFKKPITIRNQFVYIEYHDGGKLVKERYNFNKETGFNSLEELKWELSRILRAYRKAKKDYDTKGYFQKGGSLKGSKKKPRVAKEQKGRSFEDAWGRFKKDVRDNTTPRKMARGGKISHLGRAYLGELWFAVHEKNTSKYKSLANKLDREGVPMYIQNRVSSDASGTTKKAIDTAEVKDRIDKIVAQKMARGGEVDEKLNKALKKGEVFEFSDDENLATVGYRDFYGKKQYYIEFNGKMVHSSKTFDSFQRKLTKLINEYNLQYQGEQEFAKGGKIDEKIKILKKEGYPHKQAVAIAYSMRDSGKYAKGGFVVMWYEDEQNNFEYFDKNELEQAKDFFSFIKNEKFYYEKPKVVLTSINNGEVIMGERFETDKGYAKGGKVKDFEKGKWLQGKQWHIYKNNGWQLERYRGDNLIEQYSISVEKGDVDFIKYTPNYEGRIKIPENVQLKVIKLLSKVNPKFNFGDEYENQIRVNQYSDMYARGGEVNKLNMKNEQQIEKRIDKLNNRIKLLDLRYEATKSEYLFNQIKSLEIQVNLLRWTLGKDEVYDKGGKIKEFISYDIPQSYAYALINADSSALSDKDEELLNEFVDDVKDQFGNAYFLTGGEESFEPRFEPSNDVVYNQGSDVVTLYINPSNS